MGKSSNWLRHTLVCAATSWLLMSLACHAEAAAMPEINLKADDRVLILAPHPDDEVLGCAGIIQDAVKRNLPVRIVFLTYGDNNEWSFLVYRKRPVVLPGSLRKMGLVRRSEAIAAARELGLAPEQLTFLGYPDFGTLKIWYAYWGDRPPFRSMLTRVRQVPYANAFRPGAAYRGHEILRDLTSVIREFRPTKIFVSHPADHNGDHRALYLFTRIAL
jgi:LmbE family N-acetylglucosaminyl deacetylase